MWTADKYPQIVEAFSLLCYWAVHELGVEMARLSRKIEISIPAVGQPVPRGEKQARHNHDKLIGETQV